MGFSKQEYWRGLPCFLPGDLPGPRIRPVSCASPALAEEFFTTSATWEALVFTGNLYVFTWLQLSVHSWLVQEQIQVQERFSFRVFKIFRLCGDRYYKRKNWRCASIHVLLKGNKLEERQKMKYTSGQKRNWKTKRLDGIPVPDTVWFSFVWLLFSFISIDAGKGWGQEENGVTEDEIGGWHHWLNGHEFEQTLGDSEGQGSLACCSPWGCKVLATTKELNHHHHNKYIYNFPFIIWSVSL